MIVVLFLEFWNDPCIGMDKYIFSGSNMLCPLPVPFFVFLLVSFSVVLCLFRFLTSAFSFERIFRGLSVLSIKELMPEQIEKMCSNCKRNRAIDEYEEGYLCCIQCVGYKRKYNERHKEKVNQTQRT